MTTASALFLHLLSRKAQVHRGLTDNELQFLRADRINTFILCDVFRTFSFEIGHWVIFIVVQEPIAPLTDQAVAPAIKVSIEGNVLLFNGMNCLTRICSSGRSRTSG